VPSVRSSARPRSPRLRFWLEAGLATASAALLLLTLLAPDWIEAVFGVDPDAGNGSLEWALVGVLAVTAIAVLGAARREWRRPLTTPSRVSRETGR
jgi:hypothetical protein